MTTKQNSFSNFIFSIGGVLAMFALLVGVYIISHLASTRVDLTQGKLYTLSQGTKNILKKLDTPVQIRYYATQGRDMPVDLKTYAQRVEDLLNEYRKASPHIQIKKFDPQPDSDAEDKANFDGVEGESLGFGSEKVYLGLSVNMLDKKQVIPFLDPRRERLLEYDISRAVANVTTTTKPVIGVMSGLPVMGEFNPMMMRMGGGRQEPWIFVSELKRDFDVREVPITSDKVDENISILIVLHPKAITDKAMFAIDQFVLRGGKLMAFVDPLSIVDAQSGPQNNPLQAAMSGSSTLDKLFKAWGLEFDQNKVVADMVFKSRINRGRGPEDAPAVLSLTAQGINTNDVVTSQLDNVSFLFSGVFTGTPAEGLKQSVLLHTSTQSQLIEKFMAQFSSEQVIKDFAASGKEYPLALRLTGKFKTAFPEGKPKEAPAADPNNPEKKEEPTTDNTPALKESAKENSVILIGDTDVVYDAFVAQVQNIFGQKLVMPVNGNLNFVQSMVEQMSGDENLIAIRSRATMNRPFTRIQKVEADAEEKYRSKIKDLEKTLADAQTKLNELQKGKEGNQRFILSKEQQDEIKKFQQKQAEVKKELKDVRKSLRRDIESMENTLKWTNILAMPLVVVVAGVSVAALKRRKTAAK